MERKVIQSTEIQLPSKWSDLSAEDVLTVTKLKMTCTDKSDFMAKSIIHFLGLKSTNKGISIENGMFMFRFNDKAKKHYVIDAITIVSMFERIEWLNDTLDIMKCPKFKGLKSPNFKLYGISLEFFINIDRKYCDYLNQNNETLLDSFFKTLYTGSKSDFKKVTGLDKMAVVFWYSGFKVWLRERYDEVFSSAEISSDEEYEQTPVEDYLMNLVASLNEGRAADNEKIKNGNMHEMLYELNRKIEYANKMKK